MRVNEKLDYREMDPSELDSNIPQGRGMIKWAPFATMPEQYEAVDRMIERQTHVSEPSLGQDELQELEVTLRNSIGKILVLRYWDSGYEVQLECKLEYIENWGQTITVSKGTNLLTINFTHIYEIVRISDEDIYSID
ncbi:YolD-like family protein [Lacicoccus qingdaonensis]|uniref:YolD-like protein n=1 Tax=Lacicoccus qingdaonensis TaxID=576118 RepID=A0A1G9CTI4_9BACL|nr:YolD-like family protein [Salinicoccus qingdaonensis]SDK55001.1 YolD-like protein [Salinicoccus qingdaonensis]